MRLTNVPSFWLIHRISLERKSLDTYTSGHESLLMSHITTPSPYPSIRMPASAETSVNVLSPLFRYSLSLDSASPFMRFERRLLRLNFSSQLLRRYMSG